MLKQYFQKKDPVLQEILYLIYVIPIVLLIDILATLQSPGHGLGPHIVLPVWDVGGDGAADVAQRQHLAHPGARHPEIHLHLPARQVTW